MKHTTTDYLLILSLYNSAIPLSKLLFHLEPDSDANPNACLDAKADLLQIEQRGLVALSEQNGTDYVRITALGREVTEVIATAISDNMVNTWNSRAQTR